ncbi:MAG: S8 family serine peptidase [Oleibacter sp.]|nr:S8 family serine peptidase [Thalassolituus sp.]
MGTVSSAHAGQYVITFKPGQALKTSQLQQQLVRLWPDLAVKQRMADERRIVINIPNDRQTPILDALTRLSWIEAVETDIHVTRQLVPNDAYLNQQWSLFEDAAGIRILDAYDITLGEGAVVAVADTGYVPHPDLDANRLPGYDMISSSSTARDGNGRDNNAIDEGDYTVWWQNGYTSNSSWHGSHVSGTIAAIADDGKGIAGVDPMSKFVPVRVLGSGGGSLSDIADGLIWAAGLPVNGTAINTHPADVINLSLGGSGNCPSYMQDAINAATAAGSVVVVAAGNENTNASSSTPANCDNVITVASVGRNGARASYSNYGSIVDIAAPGGGNGGGILSTIDSGTQGRQGPAYAEYQGTSMATPHVAGVVALVRSVAPDLSPAEIKALLIASARPFPGSCNGCGAGIVDAYAAVALASGTTPIDPPTDPVDPIEPPVYESITYTGPSNIQIADARRAFWFFTTPGSTSTSLNVPKAGKNSQVNIVINHPRASELSLTLVRPDGRQVGLAPFAQQGSFITYQAPGSDSAGVYLLNITDSRSGNSGVLTSFNVVQDEIQ